MFRRILLAILGAAGATLLAYAAASAAWPGSVAGPLGIALVAGGAAALGAAVALTRSLGGSLRQIREVVKAYRAGDFARRAPARSGDELGRLATTINRWAVELAAKMAALRTEGERVEALLAGMQEGVVAVDGAGVVQHHNGALLGLFGLDRSPKGARLEEAVRLPELHRALERARAEGKPVRAELEAGTRTLAARLCRLGGGEGLVMVAQDVTEERRYNDLRREFVANVSHELRTPLGLIQGYVETLKEGALQDPERAREFLETIERNVRRMTAIVQDLLELSRLEAPGQIARPRLVDVPALLERVREQFAPLAAKRGQTLKLGGGGWSGTLVADPDLLERAIANLVDNAVKYTPEGGTIEASAGGDGNVAEFRVRDTGVGIPEAEHERIFERFYRVDKSRSRDLGGTGLGLAIVKHVAQLHGGEVRVESRPGQGSLFILRLPRRTGQVDLASRPFAG